MGAVEALSLNQKEAAASSSQQQQQPQPHGARASPPGPGRPSHPDTCTLAMYWSLGIAWAPVCHEGALRRCCGRWVNRGP